MKGITVKGLDRRDLSHNIYGPVYYAMLHDALETQTRTYTKCNRFETCPHRDSLSETCLDCLKIEAKEWQRQVNQFKGQPRKNAIQGLKITKTRIDALEVKDE